MGRGDRMVRVTVERISGDDDYDFTGINDDYEDFIVIGVKPANEYGQAETRGLSSGNRDAIIEAMAADGDMARVCLRAALRRFRRWLLNDLPQGGERP